MFALYLLLLLPRLGLHELGQGDDGLEVGVVAVVLFVLVLLAALVLRGVGRLDNGVHNMITILFLSFKKKWKLIHVP